MQLITKSRTALLFVVLTLGVNTICTQLGQARLPDNVESGFRVSRLEGLGGQIVFTAEIEGSKHLFTADLSKGNVSRLVTTEHDNYSGKLSPSGEQILFVSNRVTPPQLFLTDWSGREAEQITSSATSKMFPSWSADGKEIYYAAETSSEDQKTSNIYKINLNQRKEIQVTKLEERNTAPTAHPTLPAIAYTTNRFWPGWDICIWDTKANKEACVLSGDTSFVKPEFSRDGAYLGAIRSSGNVSELGTYEYLKTSKKTKFFPSTGRQNDFTWALNDQQLIFTEKDSPEGRYKIKILDLNSGSTRVLITAPYSLKDVSWSAISQGSLEELNLIKQLKILKPVDQTAPSPKDYQQPYLLKQ